MFRITFIAISVFLLLRNSGIAQQTSDWLQPQIDDSLPRTESIEAAPTLGEELFPDELWEQPAELAVRRFKKQAVQTVTFSGGWLGATEGNDLSSSYFETSVGIGVPLGLIKRKMSRFEEPSLESGLTAAGGDAPDILGITPGFRVDFIGAADGIDIPAELYETGVSFFYRKPINDRLSAMAIVRPSVRSDFTTSDNAVRIFGLGLLIWDCVPEQLSLSFGAVALGRADLPVLPAVGLTWTPRTTTRLELQFPQSRFAWRLAKDGGASETWLSLSGGIGGNTWAVTRADGQNDEVSLGDIRFLLGLERIVDGGGGWFANVGYALNRHVEYQSTDEKTDLSDGVILQAGWRY